MHEWSKDITAAPRGKTPETSEEVAIRIIDLIKSLQGESRRAKVLAVSKVIDDHQRWRPISEAENRQVYDVFFVGSDGHKQRWTEVERYEDGCWYEEGEQLNPDYWTATHFMKVPKEPESESEAA